MFRRAVLVSIAGAPIVPRTMRYVLYRLCGVSVRTRAINPHCFIDVGVSIGRGTFVNWRVFFDASAPISVGEGCLIGPGAMLLTSSHGADHALEAAPITVEDGAWIGSAATILPGVTVGQGATVAAGAVVTRDVPAGATVGGVPARALASRAAGEAR